jgi:hypothetical protein
LDIPNICLVDIVRPWPVRFGSEGDAVSRNSIQGLIPSTLHWTSLFFTDVSGVQSPKMMRAQLEQSQRESQQQEGHDSGTTASNLPPLRNRAGESDSPYVRRHAETPVAWQLLDQDTLSRAAAENKPIFMHIGFLADHCTSRSRQPRPPSHLYTC